MSFGDYALSLRAREAFENIAKDIVNKLRPPSRYGYVTTISGPNACRVQFIGEPLDVPVSLGSIKPSRIGLLVRVGGGRGDHYVEDVIGDPDPLKHTSPWRRTVPDVPPWIAPALTSIGTPYGDNHHQPAYLKTRANIVVLAGVIRTTGSGTLFTLPPGYRPDTAIPYMVRTNGTGTGYGRLGVEPDGRVTFDTAGRTYVSLSGIMFPAVGAVQWTDLALQPGWEMWGAGHGTPRSGIDAEGRVWTSGMVKRTSGTGVTFAELPVGHRPAEAQIICTWSGSDASGYQIQPTGLMSIWNGTNSASVALSSVFTPAAIGFNDPRRELLVHPSRAGAWSRYDLSWAPGTITAYGDGVALVEGMVKAASASAVADGSIASTIAPLPGGRAPNSGWWNTPWGGQELFTTLAHDQFARTSTRHDDYTNGNHWATPILAADQGLFLWRSLSGIQYVIGA